MIGRCPSCYREARLTFCDCCGLSYCAKCAAGPDEGGFDCPNTECNLYPLPPDPRQGLTFDGETMYEEGEL